MKLMSGGGTCHQLVAFSTRKEAYSDLALLDAVLRSYSHYYCPVLCSLHPANYLSSC